MKRLDDILELYEDEVGWIVIELIDYCRELESIVDKLKKTKDKVPVVPHFTTHLWYIHPSSGEIYKRSYEANMHDVRSHPHHKDGEVIWVSVEDCFSSREVAEKVREKENATSDGS